MTDTNTEQPRDVGLKKKSEVDVLSMPQRWAGMYTVALLLLLTVFFLLHQRDHTGFFTGQFRLPEMLALYVPIIISLGPPIQRLIQGRRNAARPLEAVSDLVLALGSLWLLTHFPFDFAHLADLFPAAARPALSWLNNNIGRVILILQVVIGLISCLATLYDYMKVKGKINSRLGQ